MIRLHRVYDHETAPKGEAYLVERLWPRGIKKEQLRVNAWLKEAAPSTELRKWFSHDPAKWEEFRKRYFAELDSREDAWAPLLATARRGLVTLLYSSKDELHNNAVALRDYLERRLKSG